MLDAEPWIRYFPVSAPPTTPWTVLFFPHSGGSYQHLAAQLADMARTACVHPFEFGHWVLTALGIAGWEAVVGCPGPLLSAVVDVRGGCQNGS